MTERRACPPLGAFRHTRVMDQPLLVTGSNRSGTTWVGEALCQSDELGYLYEPFNSSLWPRLLPQRLGGHYTYVCRDNEGPFLPAIRRLLDYRFPLASQLGDVTSPRDAARLGVHLARSEQRRRQHRRPFLKDPIALFASEWLADRFDVLPIVLVRHPAAFASSIRRLEWDFDFGYLLGQELLMRDHLEPFRAELERAAAERPGHLDQAILLWRIFYSVVYDFRTAHPDWVFLRYEDLAEEPAKGFAELYARVGLRYDAEVARRVASFSDEGNVKEVATREQGTVRRDSRAAMWTWRTRLEPAEAEYVRSAVADVADRFYDAEDWAPPATSA